MRWKMCPKCGVKLSIDIMEEDVTLYKCPICGKTYIKMQGTLRKKYEVISKMSGKDLEDLIIEYAEWLRGRK